MYITYLNVFRNTLLHENLDFFIHYSLVQIVKRFPVRRIFASK